MSAPQRVTAEFGEGDGFMVVFDDGEVRWFKRAAEVVREVRRRDGRTAKAREKAGELGVVVTAINWTNVPDGFVPPS